MHNVLEYSDLFTRNMLPCCDGLLLYSAETRRHVTESFNAGIIKLLNAATHDELDATLVADELESADRVINDTTCEVRRD